MQGEGELDRLEIACRALPKARGVYRDERYVPALLATVLDFQMHTTAVVRALRYFEEHHSAIKSHADLVAVLDRFPDTHEGNTELAQFLWGNHHWTRAGMLRNLVTHFEGVGVTDLAGLQAWARSSNFQADFAGRVKGLGPAVYQWLVMRQGVQTVKPDVHVRRFVETTLGRPVADAELVTLLEIVAGRLGVPASELDWAIWEAGRGAPA